MVLDRSLLVIPIVFRLFAVLIFAFSANVVAGIITYWDGGTTDIPGNDASASAGGSGIWNTTLKNWDIGVSPRIAWDNKNGDIASFGGTAGTVTLGWAIVANALTFDTSGYVISGANTLTFNGVTPGITVGGGLTATIGNNTATILAGTVGLTKTGGGRQQSCCRHGG